MLCKYSGTQCELVMRVSLSLLFTPSKGLEAFGGAESVLRILCLQPSLHSAAMRKVTVDEPLEMGDETLLLTEAQLALRLLVLPSLSFISRSRWLNSIPLFLAERCNPFSLFPSSAGLLKTANCCCQLLVFILFSKEKVLNLMLKC